MAVTSAGAILINAARLHAMDDPAKLLELLANEGGAFIGLVLRPSELSTALLQLDDATAEIAAAIGGARGGRQARR